MSVRMSYAVERAGGWAEGSRAEFRAGGVAQRFFFVLEADFNHNS